MNLVTGATGLVGSHVLFTLLQQGKAVVGTKRPTSNLSEVERVFSYYTPDYKNLFSKIIWRDADFSDVLGLDDVLKDITTVYHCAALVSLNNSDRNQLLRTNTEGTANLVNACISNKIDAFCFVSSITVLQNPDIKGDLDETVFWKNTPNQNMYSLSKYLAEQEVWRGMEEGLNAVIVNPGVIVGPGNWDRGTGKLFSTSYKGVKFYTEGVNGFVGVTDVAKAMIGLVDKKIFGERFVLVENNYSFKYILQSIHKALGKTPPQINAGRMFLNIGRMFTFLLPKDLKVNASMIETLLGKSTYSNQKIVRVLDYKFTPISESIELAANVYKKERANL